MTTPPSDPHTPSRSASRPPGSPPPNEALEECLKPVDALRAATTPTSGAAGKRPNVVVIMTDTLRPDHIAAGNTADSPEEWEQRKRQARAWKGMV